MRVPEKWFSSFQQKTYTRLKLNLNYSEVLEQHLYKILSNMIYRLLKCDTFHLYIYTHTHTYICVCVCV